MTTLVDIRDVTSANIAKLINMLGDDENIVIGRKDGRAEISFVRPGHKGKIEKRPLKNYLFSHLNLEPTPPGWMNNKPIDEGWANWQPRRKRLARDKSKPNPAKIKEQLKASFMFEIACNRDEQTPTVRDGRHYFVYQIGNYEVFASSDNNRTPLMYRRNGNPELNYL